MAKEKMDNSRNAGRARFWRYLPIAIGLLSVAFEKAAPPQTHKKLVAFNRRLINAVGSVSARDVARNSYNYLFRREATERTLLAELAGWRQSKPVPLAKLEAQILVQKRGPESVIMPPPDPKIVPDADVYVPGELWQDKSFQEQYQSWEAGYYQIAVRLPDFYGKKYIEMMKLPLDGGRTLGDMNASPYSHWIWHDYGRAYQNSPRFISHSNVVEELRRAGEKRGIPNARRPPPISDWPPWQALCYTFRLAFAQGWLSLVLTVISFGLAIPFSLIMVLALVEYVSGKPVTEPDAFIVCGLVLAPVIATFFVLGLQVVLWLATILFDKFLEAAATHVFVASLPFLMVLFQHWVQRMQDRLSRETAQGAST